jgi:ornithine--oxo-acid transaminase
MDKTKQIIEQTEEYGAQNYSPLPIVLSHGEGCWVTDVEGRRYMDMLSAYSALNHGHRHPRILKALQTQAEQLTLTSRAFYNDQLGELCEEVAELCGMEKMLPMNTGAEAVETALKLARKWGYESKGVPAHQAEIIVCDNNFHGRTISIVSFSTEPEYREPFGPLTPGFVVVPYGDSKALEAAITPNTVAFLYEPIQGEGGVVVPPEGYLSEATRICRENNVLVMADEIQTGMGRTGRWFCFQHEDATPDVIILGKALGGGVYPVSAVVSTKEIMGLFRPGEHGSTFGGNPLGAAVAREAIRVLRDEKLPERSQEMGEKFRDRLRDMNSPLLKEIRGKGLLIGVELHEEYGGAKPYCKALMKLGVLCKETREHVIRFAPPLTLSDEELSWAMERIEKVLLHSEGVQTKA